MPLIFDSFASETAAILFAADVARAYERDVSVFTTVEASDAAHPFPYDLTPPIVHVSRDDDDDEEWCDGAAANNGGRFAGT